MIKDELLINIAIDVINTEIKGLESLNKFFDNNFLQAIKIIASCQGKVIISGIGKSGHIAKKISATFASTGTPSFFIHPTEASHGDLGMISKDDIVILLSNSGQTKEIRDILYYCKKLNIPVIGITRRIDSELAKMSLYSLIIPEVKEANEINAPTTSTTMMLALGDAMAVCLMKIKKFNSENFSVFHPGGKLGSALLKVKSLMKTDDLIPKVYEKDQMDKVIIEISSKRLGCCAVLDEQNQLTGIITDGDLRRSLSKDFFSKNAKDIMTKNPYTIPFDITVNEAIEIMNKKSITCLLIVDNNNFLGVINIHDCVKEINT
jgi:arabinose-5-phosphate isomerase